MIKHHRVKRIQAALLCVATLLVVPAGMALDLHGELIQGGMVWGKTQPGNRVKLDGKPVRVADDGLFVFGFGRDAQPGANLEICQADACQQHPLTIQQRQYDIQYVEGVPQETVTPPAEVLSRIRQEAALVGRARRGDTLRRDFAEPFIWPVKGPVTGVFGSQRVYNGQPRRPHFGVDVARATGTTVVAPTGGKVTLVHEDMFYSGGTLVIDHGHGVSSTFIHLSKILVKEGQEVSQGTPIAEVGASGRATGPHLDWRMNWFGVRLDPELLVEPMPAGAGN